jgi:hypothetical protein
VESDDPVRVLSSPGRSRRHPQTAWGAPAPPGPGHSLEFDVDYPDRDLNR